MYQVSENYLAAELLPFQHHKITGTIGSISFDESNIVAGSFQISNQCASGNDILPGAVFIGQLTATFTGINLTRGEWRNKTITPTFYLRTSADSAEYEYWEPVPMGIFKVKEAKHTAEGVQITAYDNMCKFDKTFKKRRFKYTDVLFHFVNDICQRCHVTFGMTGEELSALPNGSGNYSIYGLNEEEGSNDIQTYRDCLSYIAQVLGCFATIDRVGQLVFRRFGTGSSAVDNIGDTRRIEGCSFEDYSTKYTGIFVNDMETGEEIYYGYDEDNLEDMEANLEVDDQDLEAESINLENEHDAGTISDADYAAQAADIARRKLIVMERSQWVEDALEDAPEVGEGAAMILGDNPFLQQSDYSVRDTKRWNIVREIMQIQFVPFTSSIMCGSHFDLGDVIEFAGGHAGTTAECLLMAYDYTLNAEYQMQGFGADPDVANVHSLARKKASVAIKDVKATDVQVTNYYDASTGVEIASIAVNGESKSIYAPYNGGQGGGYGVLAYNQMALVTYEVID